MKKILIALAVAGAFSAPVAAQMSPGTDKSTGASGAPVTGGSNAADRASSTPKSEAGATAPGGFAALDRNNDGYISRDEAKDASWANRFSELDKDNDGRLSRSEFEAMTSSGASGSTTVPDRAPSKPKQ